MSASLFQQQRFHQQQPMGPQVHGKQEHFFFRDQHPPTAIHQLRPIVPLAAQNQTINAQGESVTTLKKELANKNAVIAGLTAVNKKLKQKVEDEQKHNDELNGKLKQCQEQNKKEMMAMETDRDEKARALAQCREQLKNANVENAKLKNDLVDRRVLDQQKLELEQVQREKADQKMHFQLECEKLQKLLDEAEERNSQLWIQNSVNETKLELSKNSAQHRVAAMRNEIYAVCRKHKQPAGKNQLVHKLHGNEEGKPKRGRFS